MSSTHDPNEFGPLFQTRRQMLQTVAGAAALTAAGPLLSQAWAAELKGRINHSVCLWCYDGFMKQAKMNLDQFAAACAKLGLKSIELTEPDQWPTLKKHNLICAMTPSHSIPKGFNRVENHEECIAKVKKGIDDSAAAGFPNVICFSGNRAGMDDQEGLANSIAGLKKVAGYAEKKKVTICLEFLNSHDHKDYMADSTKWCVGLVHGVGSPRVKVLYDIYHAGMMKEDIACRHQGASRLLGPLPHRRRARPQRDRRDADARITPRFSRPSPTRVSRATWPRSSFPSGRTP